MRFVCSIAGGAVVLAFTLFVAVSDANAVVCARGVYRAGCAGPAGAVVVRKPPVTVCKTTIVNGVAVRRCT